MEKAIQELCLDPVFKCFRKISDIPRGSYHEKAVSDYLYRWAVELGLEAVQDEVNNVWIRKPASAGREAAPVVMLQAHMDMVCEKAENCNHDFEKDPIAWVIEDGRLTTGGMTTLGADDGIGVALAMAILEDDSLEHPDLEVLFTVAEEEDFTGAEHFDTSRMKARTLINLDHTVEDEIVCGSCGGMRVDVRMPVTWQSIPEDHTAWKIRVSGLKGGHSGEDIHRGRGNANALLARMLDAAGDHLLSQITGGTFRLAIAREAEAVIWLKKEAEERVRVILHDLEQEFRRELSATGDDVTVTMKSCSIDRIGCVPDDVITLMLLCPDGILQMDEVLEGVVDTSNNMGEVRLAPGGDLHIVTEIRSLRASLREAVYAKIRRLVRMVGGICERSTEYPSWDYQPDSLLYRRYREAVLACGGPETKALSVHAGLEVGCFFATRPDIDAISIGPDCRDFHSPTESLGIESSGRIYRYLCETLRKM